MRARNPLDAEDAREWVGQASARRLRALRLIDGAARTLSMPSVPAAMALFGAAARVANAAGLHGPRPAEIETLLGPQPRGRSAAIARSITALHAKNRAAIALVQGGRTAELSALVVRGPGSAADALVDPGGPRLAVAAHVGAFFGIRAALHGTTRPVLMVRDQPLAATSDRARVLKEAVDHVRRGGLVVTTLDGPGGTSSHEVDCLGRRIVLRRGPLALARMTGVPIVPVVCAWTAGGRIVLDLQPPVVAPSPAEPAAAEHALAVSLAQWLETYLRAHPEQLWISTLGHYLAAPPSPPSISRTRS